ncbi:MAG: hypothetical protein HOL01_09630 [Planctomycetaceae bacterium]|nr:hypothetical protein [Planctomycetaceae bacterium]MBT6486874.1 hypothetical protein [Planctomycetaceae bacterium]MBT6494797.1 hypothetical protein [Planctomycetaceae bacterium]
MQESVDAVLNQPPPPPVEAVEIIDYVAPGWLAGRGYSGQTGWVADVRAIYIFQSEIGHAPAFGQLTGPTIDRSAGNAPPAGVQGSSHNLSAEPVSLNGPGFRFSLLNQNSDGWFRGVVYEGIFINGKTRAGGATDIDNIHANLHSRTLADNNALNDDFDSGLVDFASDDVTLDQQIVDIIFGKKSQVSDRTTTFWNVGVRVASSDMKREVLYRNVEDLVLPGPIVVPDADTDTANVDFNSEMLGLGPVLGAGGTWKFGRSLALSGDVSLAAVYSNFDLRRNERNFNQSLSRTAFSDITMESSGVVPMMQCSFELSYQMASDWNCAIGYNASLLVGGARSIAIPGWDDVDDETSPYVVEENDIFSHGVYLRVSYFLGS